MSIIGVSGKISSGKDTVGKIIQYLTDGHQISFNDWLDDCNLPNYIGKPTWKIVKFASKLKQCVAIIIGCNVEDLEKEEFKNSNIGKQWNKTIINPLCSPNANCEGGNCNPCYKPSVGYNKHLKEDLTYRKFLQLFGTEVGRQIHSNTWVNALFADYDCACIKANMKPSSDCENCSNTLPNWLITDVRFPNEFDAIKERGGINIRVERINSTPQTVFVNKQTRTHPSETALDNHKFDYTIDNNGTIEELIGQVKQILIKEKLL